MNFLPLIVGFLLFKMLPTFGGGAQKNGNQNKNNNSPFSNFSIDEIQQALQLVSLFNKVKDKKADIGDVMSELMSNPLAQELFKRFSGASGQQNATPDAAEQTTQEQNEKKDTEESTDFNQNDFGGKTTENSASQSDSDFAQDDTEELFKPIENIAGVEVSETLKKYYDNWYVK